MKHILLILICIFSLNAKSVEELYNELSYLNNDFLQKKLAENYKKYGKENQSIQEYEKQYRGYKEKRANEDFSEENINKYFSKTKNKSVLDRDYFQVRHIEQENISNALDKYYDEIHERALQNKPFISADDWLENEYWKLRDLVDDIPLQKAIVQIQTLSLSENIKAFLGAEIRKKSSIEQALKKFYKDKYNLELNKETDNFSRDYYYINNGFLTLSEKDDDSNFLSLLAFIKLYPLASFFILSIIIISSFIFFRFLIRKIINPSKTRLIC
ncbi:MULTISPECIES: hypothetical protein [unclassified Campylobacter]|uniref:hypothetical protein n=1 Tax=unclassified Campylobacter TaxID=2593542 RepID=UPI001BDA03FE|nr:MULTISPECIES: hypothetical protein [unclassified Campylobacter]MBT0879855.1 hypothetical protein [Campylobacter sp. 2018MI27]MBT0884085.1 hypothetical protein [Campylobacter sp. 2018MI10]